VRQLADKVAVVTGAASGIGQALARGLAAKGAHLALVDIDEPRLREVAANLGDTGRGGSGRGDSQRRVSIHVADVSDRQRMQALPDEVVAEHGGVDLLVNNAGVTIGAMFADHSIEDAEWLLRINLLGVIYGCKFFLPELQKAESAHIVNLSSMFGIFAMPGQAMYSASKAAVRGFTEALWTELAETSIRLTIVHPGGIRTNVIRSARGMNAEDRASADAMVERFGMPADRAAAKIIRAIERDRRRLLIGVDAHVAVFLKRVFPVGFQRLLTLAFRRGLRA
jgi:short-subunit dehydrogenase